MTELFIPEWIRCFVSMPGFSSTCERKKQLQSRLAVSDWPIVRKVLNGFFRAQGLIQPEATQLDQEEWSSKSSTRTKKRREWSFQEGNQITRARVCPAATEPSRNSSERRPHYVNQHHLWIDGFDADEVRRDPPLRGCQCRGVLRMRLALSKTQISI